ncbi:unnamed protein product [Amoebophrya sp. A120]|nr:unnamed protein product [Amoebophrya sp. A120]|eukprot:GSA120T00004216001.1
MWNSKLGNAFPKAEIDKADAGRMKFLRQLRNEGKNSECVDCGAKETAIQWAVLPIGSFVCVRCASLHRGLGTHISKVKGLTGTYLWGPDEVAHMIGNSAVAEIYGGAQQRQPPTADDATIRAFMSERYDRRAWFSQEKFNAYEPQRHGWNSENSAANGNGMTRPQVVDPFDDSTWTAAPQAAKAGVVAAKGSDKQNTSLMDEVDAQFAKKETNDFFDLDNW